MENPTIKGYIYRYSILQDGKFVESKLIGWRTALAHARKWTTNLFTDVQKVEILNLWTGEIIELEEAERRAQFFKRRVAGTTDIK